VRATGEGEGKREALEEEEKEEEEEGGRRRDYS
jgi:hypothetical protein